MTEEASMLSLTTVQNLDFLLFLFKLDAWGGGRGVRKGRKEGDYTGHTSMWQ